MSVLRLAIAGLFLLNAAAGQIVDEIVAHAIEARGGLENIKAVRTQRLTGQITFGETRGRLLVEIKRPARIREQFDSGGELVVRVSDGLAGWVRAGIGEPRPLAPADVRSLTASADLDGPLVDAKAKGNDINLAGIVDVDGRTHYKLTIHQRDGQVRTDYIDAETLLETKWEGKVTAGGKEFIAESVFGDYRRVSGIMCAFRIDSTTPGTTAKQRIVFDRIEINPPIDDQRFQKPQ